MDRHNEPGTSAAVCLRESDVAGMALPECLERLDELGVGWSAWAHSAESPSGSDLVCDVRDPITVDGVLNGVDYRYYSSASPGTMRMSCELAVALHRLGDILADYDIDEVQHIGTYNCRAISGSSKLSRHGLGLAIDIFGFTDVNGEDFVLEDHWEHETSSPVTEKGRVLYEIAQRMHIERVFNVVLTPNYNAGHDNHFHVDLTDGSHFLGVRENLPFYFGPNVGAAGCADPSEWHGEP